MTLLSLLKCAGLNVILGFRVQGSVISCRECQSARVSFSDPQLRLLSGACGAVFEGQKLGICVVVIR